MKSDVRYMSQLVDWCLALEVDPDEVIGKSRAGVQLVEARQAIVWLLRQRFRLSYPQLGRILDRDHTTMISSDRKVARAVLNREAWILDILERVEHSLAPRLELESPLETLRRCSIPEQGKLELAAG